MHHKVEEEKNQFYDDLNVEMQNRTSNCIVMRGFNGHVGSSVNGMKEFMVDMDGESETKMARGFWNMLTALIW